MLFKRTIALFIIFTFFSPLNAFWQIAAWQKLRQEATKLAGRVLTSLYSPEVNSTLPHLNQKSYFI